MQVIELKDLTRKETPLHYIREFHAMAALEGSLGHRDVPLAFTIEKKPVGQPEISVRFLGEPDWPLLPPHPVTQGHDHGDGQEGRPALTEIILGSRDETEAFGEAIGRSAPGGLVIAFRGDLGAGKTVMAKGIGRGLGIKDEVTSPTFTILSEYEGRLRLHHMDAYRLSGPLDFEEMGGEEILADRGGVSLIEWSERIAPALPPFTESIEIHVLPDGSRRTLVEGPCLEALAHGFDASRGTHREGRAAGMPEEDRT